MNAEDYEYSDLKDIRKETTIGFNVTLYPNVVYSQRDDKNDKIYDDGRLQKGTGITIRSNLQLGYVDENRVIRATIGEGVRNFLISRKVEDLRVI